MSALIETKFGDAYLHPSGYYRIIGGEYTGKSLHRLVFEDFYQIKLDEEFDEPMVIHHIDGDKTNNEIWNLDIMSASEHSRYHVRKQSKANNKIGYYHVSIQNSPHCKQGFCYRYTYYENGKQEQITCVDLDGLKEKVIKKGLKWEAIK